MPGKRAKILSAPDVGDLLVFASCTRQPLRNTVMVLLSAKAGLRAGEIAEGFERLRAFYREVLGDASRRDQTRDHYERSAVGSSSLRSRHRSADQQIVTASPDAGIGLLAGTRTDMDRPSRVLHATVQPSPR
jgi:hypothetical protein